MKKIDLTPQNHSRKVGHKCEYIEPNVTEDSIFYYEGIPIGFYLTNMPEKMNKLVDLANAEFLSDRVPKSKMSRGTKKQAIAKGVEWVEQYSTILGSVPPKAHMRRLYKSIGSVHGIPTAKTFIKAMLLLAKESEKLIKEILPEQYEAQKELLSKVDEQWKFGNLFTSSISNFNISAPFHQDNANIKGAVNVIITKRKNANHK